MFELIPPKSRRPGKGFCAVVERHDFDWPVDRLWCEAALAIQSATRATREDVRAFLDGPFGGDFAQHVVAAHMAGDPADAAIARAVAAWSATWTDNGARTAFGVPANCPALDAFVFAAGSAA